MAAPNSTNEVTARKLASFATSLWTKMKGYFAKLNLTYGTRGFVSGAGSNPEILLEKMKLGTMQLYNGPYGISVKLYEYDADDEANATLVWDSTTLDGEPLEKFKNGRDMGTIYTSPAGKCVKAVYDGHAAGANYYIRAFGVFMTPKQADNSHKATAVCKINGVNYASYTVDTYGGLVTTVCPDGNYTYLELKFTPKTADVRMRFYGFRCLNTYDGVDSVLIGRSSTTSKLYTARKLAVNLANTSTDSTFDGSADQTGIKVRGTLTVGNGGTGKTSAKDACNAFINALDTESSTPVDEDYYVSQYVNGGTTTKTFYRRPVSALWEYIKSNISSVLGLTVSSYGGTAAYASNAAPNSNLATLLDSFGNSISGLTSAVGSKAALDQNPSRVVYYGTTTKDELIAIIDAGYQPICYYTQSAGGSAWFTYSGKKNGYYFFYAPILWQGAVRTQWLACHSESGNTIWEYAYIDMTADGAAVADVNYDSTNNKLTKTKGGQTTDIVSMQSLLENVPVSSSNVPGTTEGGSYALPICQGGSTWKKFTLGQVWNWIEYKISTVLHLNASNYGGTAYMATNDSDGLPITTTYAKKAEFDSHTHPLSITAAESSQSASLTLAPNTIYALTAGGSTLNFKTQPGAFFATYGLTTYADFVQAYIAGCDIYVTYPYNSGGAHYLNVHKPQIVTSEYNNMYSFIMVFDAVNMSSGTTGTIMWQLSQSGWKCYHNGTWESGAQYMYSPVDFYAPNLATKTDLNSYATTASLTNYATLNDLAGVSRYGGQHVSCLLRVGGSWSNTIEGKVYDARGNIVKTIDSAGSIPALVNQTSDVTELFIKVTSSYSGTGTIGFNFGDIASEKPLRIHVRNSSGYTFRIKLRKESAETTTCTFYTATAADAATSFNMDTSANGTSDWVVMVSGVENNSCYVINRI